MLDFTIVRDQNAKRTNMELLARTKEAIGKCLNAHLCRHMKYARIGRINKNEQCSVYELTNLYNALSSPLSFADGVGMQGSWDLLSYSENGIVTTDVPDGYVTLIINETQLLPNLASDGKWTTYTQVDFNTITTYNSETDFTITIVYNSDGTLTASWTNKEITYILIFERILEEAKDCCVTREDIIAAYCHVINYCGCTPIANGEFPNFPEPPECSCADGITFSFPYSTDSDVLLYYSLYLSYRETVRDHCVFTFGEGEQEITLSYNETLSQWEVSYAEGIFATSPDLIGTEWVVNYGDGIWEIFGITECGNTLDTLCISVITEHGSVNHEFFPLRDATTLLTVAYGGLGNGELFTVDAISDYWVLEVLDIDGNDCLAAEHKIYAPIDVPPLGTYIDPCHRKIIISNGPCTELTACQLLYVKSAQKLEKEDGMHSIELEVYGGTPPYTFQWYSDAGMTVLVANTSTIGSLSCGDQRWFRVTDSDGCTFEDSRTIICT